jgi:acyl carrier protein phosphodiesterase
MDVVYDHFLATDLREFTDESLLKFSTGTYTVLDSYEMLFPERFKLIYPYMKQYNWLYNYKTTIGIQRSFEGISYRALYMSESNTAFRLFNDNYEELKGQYADFFPSLKKFAFDFLGHNSSNKPNPKYQ